MPPVCRGGFPAHKYYRCVKVVSLSDIYYLSAVSLALTTTHTETGYSPRCGFAALELHALKIFSTLSASGRGLFASNLVCVRRVSLHQVNVNGRCAERSFGPRPAMPALVVAQANQATALLDGAVGARRPVAASATTKGTLPPLNSFDRHRAMLKSLPDKSVPS